MIEGIQGEGGPGAAGHLGDGEQRTPVVGETIKGAGRKDRLAGFERG